ncbi:MAG: CBS domain-containing protein [Candidatus Thorarchaeota archaeon]|nr:MAG: inosine-5-monophosphate dehydrogenase [Candidatus Thorarchaeota archaeon]
MAEPNPTHSMFVRDIMAVKVVTMPPDASVREVARSMKKMDIGSVIVTDKDRPLGIITEADIVRRVIAEKKDADATRASEIMSSPIIHVEPGTGLTDAMRVMAKSNIRRLAVLKNSSLAGIITSRDLLRWSPELIDILVESLRLKDEETRREDKEEDEIIAFGGECDSCGEYATDLVLENGEYLCGSCREAWSDDR